MGAVCAVVYLLMIIVFIPFPFYKDIVAATSGGGNREFVVERQQVDTGRILHKFPHNKVGTSTPTNLNHMRPNTFKVGILLISNTLFTISCPLGYWRRSIRHSMATQTFHPGFCCHSDARGLFRRLWCHQCSRTCSA